MLLAGTSQRACLRRVSCWFFCGFVTLDHISCRCSTGSRLLLVDILLWSWVLLPVDAPLDCLTSFNWKQQEVNKVQVSDVVNLNFSKQHLEEKKNQKENLNSFYPESNWGNEKKTRSRNNLKEHPNHHHPKGSCFHSLAPHTPHNRHVWTLSTVHGHPGWLRSVSITPGARSGSPDRRPDPPSTHPPHGN